MHAIASVTARGRTPKAWSSRRMSTIFTAPITSSAARIRLSSAAISGVGYTPNWHDALTGSDRDGRAFPGNINMTYNNWSSSEFGKAMLGHIDRTGLADNEFARSWNSSHQSRGCSQADLIATGGNGLFYCFAQ